ncbi:MAG: hypothetical protein RDV48_18895 [Candidatus Eremiobacteraeota bacterium]|nr:hypothetical protein [Candidatus Eremiobacteraeota bacterium]
MDRIDRISSQGSPLSHGSGKNPLLSGGEPLDILKKGDGTNDSATIGANIAHNLKDSPIFDKLNALIAGALMVSGVKELYSGLKDHDRVKFLKGSKQTMWGTYHGLHALETVFKTAFSLTPGLRIAGGFLNADLGLTGIYRDYKDDRHVDRDLAMSHGSAASWGLRHLSLGLKDLAGTRWAASLVEKGSPALKGITAKAPLMGAIGAALGVAGGALDVALGARLYKKGVEKGEKELKVLGALDMGVGAAMSLSCVLSGLPSTLVMGAAGIGMVYRTWRTDKDEIKGCFHMAKEKAHQIKDRVKDFFREK